LTSKLSCSENHGAEAKVGYCQLVQVRPLPIPMSDTL